MNLAHIFIKNNRSQEKWPLYADLRYMLVEQQMPFMVWAQDWDHGLQLGAKIFKDGQEGLVCIHGPDHFILDINNFSRKASEVFETSDCQILWENSRAIIVRESFIKTRGAEVLRRIEEGLATPWGEGLMAESALLLDDQLREVEQNLKKLERFTPQDIENLASSDEKKIFTMLTRDRAAVERTIFLVNNEGVSKDQSTLGRDMRIHTMCALASGLKPVVLFSLINSERLHNIIFFDISEAALQFYRHLIDFWDGKDYPGFLKKMLSEDLPFSDPLRQSPDVECGVFDHESHSMEPGRRVEEKFLQAVRSVGGEENFYQLWQEIKKKNISFKKLDLIRDYSKLGLESFEGPALIWFSNVYDYRPTFFTNEGRKGIFEKQKSFFDYCSRSRQPIYLSGFCPERDEYIVGQPWMGDQEAAALGRSF